ncbi:MAG: hypothetical protein ACXVBE_07010, partial [Bdellovibrionota bacterium]
MFDLFGSAVNPSCFAESALGQLLPEEALSLLPDAAPSFLAGGAQEESAAPFPFNSAFALFRVSLSAIKLFAQSLRPG